MKRKTKEIMSNYSSNKYITSLDSDLRSALQSSGQGVGTGIKLKKYSQHTRRRQKRFKYRSSFGRESTLEIALERKKH